MISAHRKRRQGGNNVLEFALVALPLVSLMLGVTTTGLALARSVQVSQVSRDAASMYVRGVDFSKTPNQDILVRLTNGLHMTRTGGDGAIVLSQVTWIPQAKCVQLNLNPCNGDKHVITQRIVIGNAGDARFSTSNLGTPAPSLLDSQGLVSNYYQETSAVANFPFMSLDVGQYAYVAEARFLGIISNNIVYGRAIF